MVLADSHLALKPRRASRASVKSPVETPLRCSYGSSFSTDFALRRYRGKMLGVKVILSSPAPQSLTRGTFTGTGPIPVITSRSGKWP